MQIKIDQFSFRKSRPIITDFCLNVNEGDKIIISGRNGVGKSTLLDLIIGKYNSNIQIDYPMNLSYYGKNANLNTQSSLKNEINLFNEEIDFDIYSKLITGFNFNCFESRIIKKLSQGSQAKARLIFVLANKYKNLFLLDEPTESLDQEAVNFLAYHIQESEGTYIVISHNRNFCKRFATRYFKFENQKLKGDVV